MVRNGERALNIGFASPLQDFANPNDLKDIDVYERHSPISNRRAISGTDMRLRSRSSVGRPESESLSESEIEQSFSAGSIA